MTVEVTEVEQNRRYETIVRRWISTADGFKKQLEESGLVVDKYEDEGLACRVADVIAQTGALIERGVEALEAIERHLAIRAGSTGDKG